MVLGIDLCKTFAQVSIYNRKENTVDTPQLFTCDNSCNIPSMVCKKKGLDEWHVGDEAKRLELLSEGVVVDDIVNKAMNGEVVIVDNVTVTGDELMYHFIRDLIGLVCDISQVEYVTVCFEDFCISLLESVRKAFKNMGFQSEQVEYINRNESDMYNVLSQNKDIWYGNVAIFDYNATGLVVSMLEVHKDGAGELIIINDHECREELPYVNDLSHMTNAAVNDALIKISDRLFERKIVSAIFLTGIGFESDRDYDVFIKHVCNRRRIFIGQNIYSKGACYCSMEMRKPGNFENRTLLCKDKILYELDMDITEHGKASRLRVVRPGVNWYKARRKFDFYIDGEPELVLRKKMYGESEEQLITIGLEDIPVRPNKANKLGIGFDFESDGKLRVTVKDRGFGNFFKSSGKVIQKEI